MEFSKSETSFSVYNGWISDLKEEQKQECQKEKRKAKREIERFHWVVYMRWFYSEYFRFLLWFLKSEHLSKAFLFDRRNTLWRLRTSSIEVAQIYQSFSAFWHYLNNKITKPPKFNSSSLFSILPNFSIFMH